MEKGKTATILEDESRDVEILGSLKEGNRLLSPLSENQLPARHLFEIVLGDWPRPSSKVDSPTIKGSLAEPIVVVVSSHMEIVLAMMVSAGMTTTVTSAPLGNDSLVDFVYADISFFDSKASFLGTLGLTVPIAVLGSSREEITASITLDSVGFEIL